MQKKRIITVIVLCSVIFHLMIIPFVFKMQPRIPLCQKTVTVKPGEIAVVNFFMSSKYGGLGAMYEFEVSDGTIKYMILDPVYFQSNITAVIEFMEICDPEWDDLFAEPENGVGGFGYGVTVDCETGEIYTQSKEYNNKIWDIFLYNEDTFDKEVTIGISKIYYL